MRENIEKKQKPPITSSEQLDLIGITMDSERFNKPLSIAGIVAEINVYEDLSKGYLTADMVLQDDQDFYRMVDIVGTEKVTLEFACPDEESAGSIELNFVVEEIISNARNSNNISIISFHLIEDIKFYSDLTRFSKAYTGTGEQIITSIVKDKLGRELVIESESRSTQSVFRYIVPYQTPLNAIKTVLSKMTTESGMPFFFYSSIIDNKFYLTDLETILKTESFNVNRPFVYDQSNTIRDDLESQIVNIAAIKSTLSENTHEIAQNGAIGSNYESVNATTGQNFGPYHIDMQEHFELLKDLQILPKEQNFVAIDKEFVADPAGIDRSPITSYNSKITTKIITQPYKDAYGFNQEAFPGQERLSALRQSIFSHLLKNMYTINMPGLLFTVKNIKSCVGHQVAMDIKRNDTDFGAVTIDEKRSGHFVILNKRHNFNIPSETHNISLGLSKLANRSSIA